MSEWQPARFVRTHERPIGFVSITKVKSKEIHGKFIHVREAATNSLVLQQTQELGCSAERFFEVREYPDVIICEHEILTD